MTDTDALRRANEAAWNAVAGKYDEEFNADLARLRAGAPVLHPVEDAVLAPLLASAPTVLHLQCSHGTDTLALWRGGARRVVGVDLSRTMLAQAARKTAALGAPAESVRADVLALPVAHAAIDLVYTGKGSLPWVLDLERWAETVATVLRPGGWLLIFEAHPFTGLWEPNASTLRLRADSDYFSGKPRLNADFPASYLADAAALVGGSPLPAYERIWGLAAVVSAVVAAGLELLRLTEHPEHFWPQFPEIPSEELRRVPQSFLLLARRSRR